ncbi:hypothetical protein U9X64_31765, partial [Escherichia coli]
MTTFPQPASWVICCQIISRIRFDVSPTYTPARTSSSQIASRPRKRGGTFSVTTTTMLISRVLDDRYRPTFQVRGW